MNPPLFLDLPLESGDPSNVSERWAANSLLQIVETRRANVNGLQIAFDAGTRDQFDGVQATDALDQILSNYGIAHQYERFSGDLSDRLRQRLEEKVLPFFVANLKDEMTLKKRTDIVRAP